MSKGKAFHSVSTFLKYLQCVATFNLRHVFVSDIRDVNQVSDDSESEDEIGTKLNFKSAVWSNKRSNAQTSKVSLKRSVQESMLFICMYIALS